MRDCNQFQQMISAMLDEELSADEERALRAHIEACEDCRCIYNAFAGLSAAMKDTLADPPELLAKGIMYKINLQEGKTKRPFHWGRFTMLAACLALVIFGVSRLGYGRLGGSEPMSADVAASEPAYTGGAGAGQVDRSPADESGVQDVQPEAVFEMPAAGEEFTGELGSAREEDASDESCLMGDITGEATAILLDDSMISLELTEGSLSFTGGSFVMINKGGYTCTYREDYRIQVLMDSAWYDLYLGSDWPAPLYTLEPGQSESLEIDWSSRGVELGPGTFRVVKEISADMSGDSGPVVFYIACEFEIS